MKALVLTFGFLFSLNSFASQLTVECRNSAFLVKGLFEKSTGTGVQDLQGLVQVTNIGDSRSELNGEMAVQGHFKIYPPGSFYKEETKFVQFLGDLGGKKIFLKAFNETGTFYINGQSQPMTCSIRD